LPVRTYFFLKNLALGLLAGAGSCQGQADHQDTSRFFDAGVFA
jgi:hypothetical protein